MSKYFREVVKDQVSVGKKEDPKKDKEDNIRKISLMCEESYSRSDFCDIRGISTFVDRNDRRKKIVFGFGDNLGILDVKRVLLDFKIKLEVDSSCNKYQSTYYTHRNFAISDVVVVKKNGERGIPDHDDDFYIVSSLYRLSRYRSKDETRFVFYDYYTKQKFEKIIFDISILSFLIVGMNNKNSKILMVQNETSGNYYGANDIQTGLHVSELEFHKNKIEFGEVRTIACQFGGCQNHHFTPVKTIPHHVIFPGKSKVFVIDWKEGKTVRQIGESVLFFDERKGSDMIFDVKTRLNTKLNKETILIGMGSVRRDDRFNNQRITKVYDRVRSLFEYTLEGDRLRTIDLFGSFSSLFYIGNDFILLGYDGHEKYVEKVSQEVVSGHIYLMNMKTESMKLVSLVHDRRVLKMTYLCDNEFEKFERMSFSSVSSDSIAVYTIVGKDVLKESQMREDSNERSSFVTEMVGDVEFENWFDFKISLFSDSVLCCKSLLFS